MVFVETTAVAQELVGVLKALSLVAFALHDRTPKAQVNNTGSRTCHLNVNAAGLLLLLLPREREIGMVFGACLQHVHVSLAAVEHGRMVAANVSEHKVLLKFANRLNSERYRPGGGG